MAYYKWGLRPKYGDVHERWPGRDSRTNRQSQIRDNLTFSLSRTTLEWQLLPRWGHSHGRSSSVNSSLMSLKPAFRTAMSLDLLQALPSLVEARYKSCQSASKLIFTPSEVTILHTKSGLPVREELYTASRRISNNPCSFNCGIARH